MAKGNVSPHVGGTGRVWCRVQDGGLEKYHGGCTVSSRILGNVKHDRVCCTPGANQLYSPLRNDERELRKVQQGIQKLIRKGNELFGDEWSLPNTHGLKVMAFQTLAALQNGKFCATDSFEKAHQNNKRMGEGRKSGAGGGGGEARALKRQARMLAFKALFRGFEWGPNHAYKIAPGIIEWLGTSRILKELPTELSELIPDRTQLASTDAKPRGAGGWTFKRAFKYDSITSTEKELLNSGIRVQDEKFVLEDNAMIKYVKVLSVKNGDRTFFIHEGEHAAVIYDEALPAVGEEKKDTKLEYCQVEKIILVQQQNKSWLYFFPLW